MTSITQVSQWPSSQWLWFIHTVAPTLKHLNVQRNSSWMVRSQQKQRSLNLASFSSLSSGVWRSFWSVDAFRIQVLQLICQLYAPFLQKMEAVRQPRHCSRRRRRWCRSSILARKTQSNENHQSMGNQQQEKHQVSSMQHYHGWLPQSSTIGLYKQITSFDLEDFLEKVLRMPDVISLNWPATFTLVVRDCCLCICLFDMGGESCGSYILSALKEDLFEAKFRDNGAASSVEDVSLDFALLFFVAGRVSFGEGCTSATVDDFWSWDFPFSISVSASDFGFWMEDSIGKLITEIYWCSSERVIRRRNGIIKQRSIENWPWRPTSPFEGDSSEVLWATGVSLSPRRACFFESFVSVEGCESLVWGWLSSRSAPVLDFCVQESEHGKKEKQWFWLSIPC